jgi:hypothetical protein
MQLKIKKNPSGLFLSGSSALSERPKSPNPLTHAMVSTVGAASKILTQNQRRLANILLFSSPSSPSPPPPHRGGLEGLRPSPLQEHRPGGAGAGAGRSATALVGPTAPQARPTASDRARRACVPCCVLRVCCKYGRARCVVLCCVVLCCAVCVLRGAGLRGARRAANASRLLWVHLRPHSPRPYCHRGALQLARKSRALRSLGASRSQSLDCLPGRPPSGPGRAAGRSPSGGAVLAGGSRPRGGASGGSGRELLQGGGQLRHGTRSAAARQA